MAKTRDQKIKDVEIITDKLKRAKSVVFTDYKGLNMTQLSELRDKLRDLDAQFIVTKNSILERAIKSANLTQPADDVLGGPTATLFAYDDEISPIKALAKIFQDASIGKIKAGFLGDELIDASKVQQLSILPTKDELRGKAVGALVAPLHGIVGVLQANLRNLVYALDQIKIMKGGE